MKKSYTVFSVEKQKFMEKATLASGAEVAVQVDGTVVQLIPDDGVSGTIMLAFQGAEGATAFAAGDNIEVTFTKGA